METVLNMISNLAPPPTGPPLALPPPPASSPTAAASADSHHQQHHRQLMASMTTAISSASPAASTTPTVAENPVTVSVESDAATTGPASSSPNTSATTASAPQVSPNATMVAANPATFLVVQQQAPPQQQSPTGASSNSNTSNGTTPATATTSGGRSTTGRTFFRAPGLEAPDEGSVDFPTNALVCPDCGFSCISKFHYNSHRNTHGKHQCPICNFETRTEGRLKKHMLQSHKREQRLAHGINIQSPPPTQQQMQATVQQQQQHSPGDRNGGGLGEQHTMQMMVAAPPNSMNSFLNSMFPGGIGAGGDNGASVANGSLALESLQSMLNNTMNNTNNPLAQFSNSTDALLKICTDAIANGGNGAEKVGFHSPSATVAELAGSGAAGQIPLDQLRALTERHTASLLNSSNPMGATFGHMQIGPDGELIDGSRQNGDAKPEHNTTATTTTGSTPRRSGKPKQYRCKQCPHVSRSKKEQWEHARLHIPKQKQLTCNYPQCDFVTEYKHHLEYHYRNHNGQKPFKCTMCEYTCVNKSMLNSHMKSHTSVYQFCCQDCTYQTKYCHSLKMHLKKYNHKRAPGPSGFVDSSDSHGEERPENASSSSIKSREDTASFENGVPTATTTQSSSDGQLDMVAEQHNLQNNHHHQLLGMAPHDAATAALHPHHLLMAPQLLGAAGGDASTGGDNGAASAVDLEMASQRMMLQQQLEQMNELIRNAVVNCPHCSFSTGNIDEMNRHLLFHLIATQQQMPPALNNEQHALASIYQRLTAQLQQELIPGAEMGSPPVHHPHAHHHPLLSPMSASAQHHQQQQQDMLLSRALAVAVTSAAQQQQSQSQLAGEPMEMDHNGGDGGEERAATAEEARARQMEREAVECIRQQQQQHREMSAMLAAAAATEAGTATEADTAASVAENGGGDASTTTSSASSTDHNHHGGARPSGSSPASPTRTAVKREFAGFDANGSAYHHHHQLQHHASSSDAGTPINNSHAERAVHSATGTCVVTSSSVPLPARLMSSASSISMPDMPMMANGTAGHHSTSGVNQQAQNGGGASLPFFCQQCEIAFKDAALYQVHRGFHARESPFKCNICGHLSCSSLDFNLHLYQAKHE